MLSDAARCREPPQPIAGAASLPLLEQVRSGARAAMQGAQVRAPDSQTASVRFRWVSKL
jgi:hypothetical protein